MIVSFKGIVLADADADVDERDVDADADADADGRVIPLSFKAMTMATMIESLVEACDRVAPLNIKTMILRVAGGLVCCISEVGRIDAVPDRIEIDVDANEGTMTLFAPQNIKAMI